MDRAPDLTIGLRFVRDVRTRPWRLPHARRDDREGRRDEGRHRHGRRRGCSPLLRGITNTSIGTTALIAIHSTANRRLDASGKTTTLTVPWMTKWSSAGAQIVAASELVEAGQREGDDHRQQQGGRGDRPRHRGEQQQVDGHEREHGQQGRPPEGSAAAQVAEEIAAEQHLLGDARLREQARYQPRAPWVEGWSCRRWPRQRPGRTAA